MSRDGKNKCKCLFLAKYHLKRYLYEYHSYSQFCEVEHVKLPAILTKHVLDCFKESGNIGRHKSQFHGTMK